MIDNDIYSAIEILDAWKEQNGGRVSYSFTIDTTGFSKYKLSLYEYGEYKEIKSAYRISTDHLNEIMEKLRKGLEKCEL